MLTFVTAPVLVLCSKIGFSILLFR